MRPVELRNLSGSAVQLEGGTVGIAEMSPRVIPAHGRLILTHADYVRLATINDLSALPVEVTMPRTAPQNVSVLDFGCHGDGITDDTYNFQRAIDYVADNGGGVVNVPVGVYLVDGLMLKGDVSLVGESRVACVIKQRDASSGMAGISVYESTCEIRSLSFWGAAHE